MLAPTVVRSDKQEVRAVGIEQARKSVKFREDCAHCFGRWRASVGPREQLSLRGLVDTADTSHVDNAATDNVVGRRAKASFRAARSLRLVKGVM
jgi:hypothetical protein